MNSHRGEAFIKLRNGGLLFFVFTVVCFPFFSVAWDFLRLMYPAFESGWSTMFSTVDFLDAGGQRASSRSLLRTLLIGACLSGLLLPLRKPHLSPRPFDSVPWAGLFLLVGLLSVRSATGFYLALTEWETWALLLAFGLVLRRAAPPQLGLVALVGLYATTLLLFLHALWISVPTSTSRLGGIFHHPNALSTFTFLCLPFLIWRAGAVGREKYLAAFLAGTSLTIQIWAGSLTGACLLIGALAYSLGSSKFRPLLLFAGLAMPLFFNMLGGWVSTLGFPLAFLLLLGAHALLAIRKRPFRVVVVFLLSLTLASAAFTALAPPQSSEGVVGTRARSAAARLKFYQAAVEMTQESPVLGVGPNGFARQYPKYQSNVLYFSKFVHCLPLEFLVEWGLLGFSFGACAVASCWRQVNQAREASGLVLAFRWSAALFALHSLSDVQSQYPYLICLLILAWAVASEEETEAIPSQGWTEVATRIFLTFGLLALLILNGWRIAASLDRQFATGLYRSVGDRAQPAVATMLWSSSERLPLDPESAFLLGQLYSRWGDKELARLLGEEAARSDVSWAAPRLLSVSGSTQKERLTLAEAALRIDPVNYPSFYQFRAEGLLFQGEFSAALEVLQKKSLDYDAILLQELPLFRSDDLMEQLVEFWLLLAMLEEHHGREKEAQAAFRKSLYFASKRLSRLQGLIGYPQRVGIVPGPLVEQLLLQVAQQVPAK